MTRIHSVAGTLPAGTADHPRAAVSGAAPRRLGGGDRRAAAPTPRPGEASLAHRGVLLLDELPEFPRPVLESLRQPLEDGVVSVARVGGHALFPARFRLVATMNLCPCGGRGDPAADCGCSPQRIAAYREKVSRALLDRFDLVVAMPRPRAEELAAPPGEASAAVRARVVAARERLRDGDVLRRTEAASALLDRAVERVPLSGRGRARVARVARTVAALAGADAVLPEHLAEALSYRVAGGSRGGMSVRRHPAGRGRSIRRCCAAIPDPPPRSGCAGTAPAELLARPAVAIVGARACSSYGRSVARIARPRARGGRARRRQRLARGIDGEAHRGALDAGGIDGRRARVRHRPRLPGGAPRARRPDRRERADRVGVRAGRRAGAVALSGPQPDHRRPLRRDRRRRGARAVGRADHGRLRARGRPRGDGRARRDHLGRLGRLERAAAARRDAGDGGRRRARGVRDRARWPSRPSRPGARRATCSRVSPSSPASIDELARAAGIAPGEVAAALIELELAGRVDEADGVYRATVTR